MIKCITFLLFIFASVLILVGINKLVRLLSYEISERYLHYRYIIVTSVFAVLVSNTYLGSLLLKLIGSFVNLTSVNDIIKLIIPQRAIELIFILLCFLLLNIIFASAYVVVLLITKLVSRFLDTRFITWDSLNGPDKIKHYVWFWINKFYEEDDGIVVLKPVGYTTGIYMSGMKYATVIVGGAELIALYISIILGNDITNGVVLNLTKNFYLLPISAFFIFEQIHFFLEGEERFKNGYVTSTHISEEMLGNVEAMIPSYQECFSDHGNLLCSEFGPNKIIDPSGLMSNDTGNDMTEKCKEQGILAIIVNQLRQSRVVMNPVYQNALVGLIDGESVLVKDNTEGEFTPYYASFINYYLTQGKRAIILCTDDNMVNRVSSDLKSVAEQTNGSSMLWVLSTLDELDSSDSANILICTYNEFLRLDLDQFNAIVKYISFVVFPDCVGLINQNPVFLELLISKLKSIKSLEQYIFISGAGNNYVTNRIQQLFYYDGLIIKTYNADLRYAHSGVMVWKDESYYKLQTKLNISNSEAPYIGVALPLALMAIKDYFHKVYIIRGRHNGEDHYMHNALPHNNVIRFLETRDDVTNKIIYDESKVIEPEDMKIMCVYDDDFNFFNALWKWFKYTGKKGTIIHVISPFYMMREFFADNYKSIINDNNEYMALLNENTKLDFSRKLLLLASFAYRDLCESELKDTIHQYNWKFTSTAELLYSILITVRLPEQVHSINDFFEYYDVSNFESNPDRVIKTTKIRLTDRRLVDELKNRVSFAKIRFNMGSQSDLCILRDNVYNYYLRDQVMKFNGYFYRIDQIKDGVLQVSPDTPIRTYDYYTISDFQFSDSELIDHCVDNLQTDFNIYQSNVSRRIFGYISSTKGNDFYDKSILTDVTKLDLIVDKHDCVPILEIRIPKKCFAAKAEESVYLLSVLFNGLFKTLFPDSYQNLIAVADAQFDLELCRRVLDDRYDYTCEELIKLTNPGLYSIDIPADSDVVRLFVIEFSSVEYGMIKVLYEQRKKVLMTIYRYLNWYINSGKGMYLNYGMESVPELFAPNELLEALKQVLRTNEAPVIGDDNSIEETSGIKRKIYTCSFCGGSSYYAWKFGDDRIMCGNCHNHMKSQENEISDILLYIRSFLYENFRVSISKEIVIRFQSKDAIERAIGKGHGGRVLGFYNHASQQLWIERKGPAVAMQSTMAHELTHAWQYTQLDLKTLEKKLGKHAKQKRKVLLEGHAVFVQIMVMDKIGEVMFSERLAASSARRQDAYGVGYLMFMTYYQAKLEDEGIDNPFDTMKRLVQEIIEGKNPIEWPANIEKL